MMVTLQLYLKPYSSEGRAFKISNLMGWLALVVGNSRLHWAFFDVDNLLQRWDTSHCSMSQFRALQNQGFARVVWERLEIPYPQDLHDIGPEQPELWMASVVKSAVWGLANYPHLNVVKRQQIPLGGLYGTIGVDRALTLLGAGLVYGWPVLVVDCGTALTFTAGKWDDIEGQGYFIGGALLPGLGLQFRVLHSDTDQLPHLDHRNLAWPKRWARTTENAIVSGILHTQLAGIRDFLDDWYQRYPKGKVLFTGGDGQKMAEYLRQYSPSFAKPIQVDPDLMFWGLRAYRQHLTKGR
jgi:type III pantothenate kinase